MTVLPFTTESEQLAAIGTVLPHLRAGGLIIYPTETVFGLGGLAESDPIRRLAALKSRDVAKPFIMLLSDASQATDVRWSDAARALADAFWPGPLTLVLRDESGARPAGVVSKDGGVALRTTPHAGTRRLIEALGRPITSTSANAPDGRPAFTREDARAVLAALPSDANVWLLDGPAGGAPPSTVVDCTGPRARILRAGAVPIESIREVVHDVEG